MNSLNRATGDVLESAVELMLNIHRINYVRHRDEDLLDFWIPHKQLWLECSAKIGHVPDLVNCFKAEKLWREGSNAISILGHIEMEPYPRIQSMVGFSGDKLKIEPKSNQHVIQHAGAWFRPGANFGQTPYAIMSCSEVFRPITDRFWEYMK